MPKEILERAAKVTPEKKKITVGDIIAEWNRAMRTIKHEELRVKLGKDDMPDRELDNSQAVKEMLLKLLAKKAKVGKPSQLSKTIVSKVTDFTQKQTI